MSSLSHEFMTAGYSDHEAERLSALSESYKSTIGAATPDNYSDLIDAFEGLPAMKMRTISVSLSCFSSKFEMKIEVPEDRDAEEYIDELLEGMLNEEFRYNADWDFTD